MESDISLTFNGVDSTHLEWGWTQSESGSTSEHTDISAVWIIERVALFPCRLIRPVDVDCRRLEWSIPFPYTQKRADNCCLLQLSLGKKGVVVVRAGSKPKIALAAHRSFSWT